MRRGWGLRCQFILTAEYHQPGDLGEDREEKPCWEALKLKLAGCDVLSHCSGPMGKWPVEQTLDTTPSWKQSGSQGTLGQGRGSWYLNPHWWLCLIFLDAKASDTQGLLLPLEPILLYLTKPNLDLFSDYCFQKFFPSPSFHHQSYQTFPWELAWWSRKNYDVLTQSWMATLVLLLITMGTSASDLLYLSLSFLTVKMGTAILNTQHYWEN